MARTDLNDLLKKSWPGIAGEVRRTLPELLRISREGGAGGIRLSVGFITDASKIQWTGLDERPPGYVSPFGEGRWNFAAPMSALGWGVQISGQVAGTLRLGKTAIPLARLEQKIEIRRLRLEARATLLDIAEDMPRLSDLTIEPVAEIRLSGWINLTVTLDSTTRRGDLTNTLYYEIDLRDTPARVPGHPREIRFRGKLRLNLKPEAGIVIENGTVFDGNERYDLPRTTIPFPDLLVARRDLPRRWGENRPRTVTDAGPDGFDFSGKAGEIERAFEKHAPQSAALGNRRLALVADNRYPEPFQPCSGVPATPHKLYGIGDAAIWTGHLLAAQAFRFAAARTNGPRQDARKQALWVLEAIERLFAVPARVMGARGLLCRAALPADLAGKTQEWYTPPGGSPDAKVTYAMSDPPDPERTKYYLGVSLGKEIWYGKGRDTDPPSRDSHLGVVLGLACAYKLVAPADAEIKTRVGGLLTDMIGYLLDNGWNVPTPRGLLPAQPPVTDFRIITSFFHQFHQQLAILRVGKLVEDESGVRDGRFSRAYAEASAGANQAWISVWVDCLEPLGSYFKFNLDHACVALLLWLAGPSEPRTAYLRMFRMLRRTTGHHRNPYFHLLWALARGASALDETTPGSVRPGGGPVTVRAEIRHLLWEWSLRLDPAGGVPGPNCLPLSKTPDPAFMRRLYDEEDAREYNPGDFRSVFALPCDKRTGRDMDFMWQRDPFQTGIAVDEATGAVTVDEGDFREGVLEAPGVDYLLAHGMAAYLGVV